MQRPRRPASPAAFLFLLIGTLGGGLGGALMGFRAGQHAAHSERAQGGSTGPAASRLDASAGRWDAARVADFGGSPASLRDLGVDAGAAAASLSEVCVEVLDVGERRVAGALITWRHSAPASLRAATAIGELGVFAGPLPFPDDVIARIGPLGPTPSASAASPGGTVLRSDANGRACLRAAGRIVITAVSDERSASAELDLPAVAGKVAGGVVMRLGIPADALCRLAGPLESSDAIPEPTSDRPAGDIEGRVVDPRGFGLVGVRIDAQVGSSRAVALSDARGAYRLSGLPRGALSLSAQKRGYAPLHSNRRADEPRVEVTLTLAPGGGIAGSLRERQRGTLPAGASLVLQNAAGSQPVPLGRDGQFSLTGLSPGTATLRARAVGFAPLSLFIDIPAGQAPDELTLRDLRLELEAGATVRGQVRGEVATRVGIAVTATSEDGTVLGRGLSDERGEFRLLDLPAGRLRISASVGGHAATAVVEVRAGGQEQVQLDLQ